MKKVFIALFGVALAAGIYFFVMQTTKDTSQIKLAHLSISDVEKILEKKKAAYEAGGFSFLKVGDHYSIVAQDEKKVQKFLIEEFGKSLPSSYTSMLKSIEVSLAKDKMDVFKGMAFDMKIVEDRDGAKVEVTLKVLPTKLAANLQKDQQADTIMTNLLAKGGLSYKLAMNKEGDIQGIELRDISEDIKIDKDTIKLKVLGTWMKMVGDLQGSMDSEMGMQEFSLSVEESADKRMTFSINDIKAVGSQEGIYDQEGRGTMGRMKVDIKELDNLISMLYEGIVLKSFAKSKAGHVDAGYNFDAKHMAIRDTNAQGVESFGMNIDGFTFDAMVEHLNIKAMEAIQNLNNNSLPSLLLGTPVNEDPTAAMEAFVALLQSGLNVHINALNGELIELNMGSGEPLSLHNFKFDLHVSLKENTLDMSSPFQYMSFVKVTGKLEVLENDLTAIAGLAPMAAMILDKKKIVGNQAVFELEFDQGRLLINGAPLQ